MLATLFRIKSRRIIETVLWEVDFHENEVYYAVRRCRVIRTPEYFLMLLDRILEPESQKYAIQSGVYSLFYNRRTRYIEGMPGVLEGRVIGNRLAEDIAIRKIFEMGLFHENGFWAKRFHNHPEITPRIYAGE